MKKKGYLAFLLHAHLPFVRHPEYEYFLEEDWLFEAITETYIPLLSMMENLLHDRVPFKITVSLTPTLVSMLLDDLLQKRYMRYLEKMIELSGKEIIRTRFNPSFHKLAHFYRDRFSISYDMFVNRYRRNIVDGFRRIMNTGHLDIVTCCATHGFLPLMQTNPNAVRAQIKIATDFHRRVFKKPPSGMWLAECGYFPGVEEILEEENIRYFFSDTHAVLFGTPRPRFGAFAPVYTPAGPAVFPRDIESSKSVWSANEGYPGDYRYREFYRDIGYDLEFDYIKPFINPDGTRKNTGIKYYKITGKTDDKKPYDPDAANSAAEDHAGNFLFNREKQVDYLYHLLGSKKPIITSPYDAELFGHWWFEGPRWLNHVIRKAAKDSRVLELIHPGEYLKRHPKNQVLQPTMSSWGYKGYAEVWLNGANDWVYRHLHQAADKMVELAGMYKTPGELLKKALNQAARELLLAQASDWAFIMKTGTMVEYAQKRTRDHINNFNKIYNDIKNNQIDENWLNDVCYRNNIFPGINYRIYN